MTKGQVRKIIRGKGGGDKVSKGKETRNVSIVTCRGYG
jgi:hypothetical protein